MGNDIYIYLIPAAISIGISLVSSGITRCRVRRQMEQIDAKIQALNSRINALQQSIPPAAPVMQPAGFVIQPSAPVYPYAQPVTQGTFQGYI
jgi:hypothetical protein